MFFNLYIINQNELIKKNFKTFNNCTGWSKEWRKYFQLRRSGGRNNMGCTTSRKRSELCGAKTAWLTRIFKLEVNNLSWWQGLHILGICHNIFVSIYCFGYSLCNSIDKHWHAWMVYNWYNSRWTVFHRFNLELIIGILRWLECFSNIKKENIHTLSKNLDAYWFNSVFPFLTTIKYR